MVHRCAHGPLHIWPSYRAPRSWITPIVAVVNQQGGTGKITSLYGINKFGFVRLPDGVSSIASTVLLDRSRLPDVETFPNLRGVCFIRRRQPRHHWCTDVQRALCTNRHRIEHSRVGARHHASCCCRKSQERPWHNYLLVRHQRVRIRPPSRGSLVQLISHALRPMPDAGRRNFFQLARRTLYPATAIPAPLVHRYAKGHLHICALYRVPRS